MSSSLLKDRRVALALGAVAVAAGILAVMYFVGGRSAEQPADEEEEEDADAVRGAPAARSHAPSRDRPRRC